MNNVDEQNSEKEAMKAIFSDEYNEMYILTIVLAHQLSILSSFQTKRGGIH